ncbi:hypothetical protein PCANC_26461 [Puccinia coronata f. sp. avenae]|uniref:Uncharacterized protein n=1 Tax=Puccinia coronata f. sp. avenae TaxID=200324 RepID=A0A2N5TRD4_9BASI|nr:hypothetical protein PCANC_26461 [Puccinia coronata f. sp. avenae]
MLHTPKQPNPTSGNSASSGVVVPPEVWEQMQLLLSTFGPSHPINPSPSPIIRQLAPSLATSLALNEDNATFSPPVEKLQPLVQDDVLTENHHVSDWTPDLDPVNKTITVNGVISDIKQYNFASGQPLDPPPSAQFNSMDTLLKFCQKWAKEHGYAVAKAHSNGNKNVYIRCNQSGEYCGFSLNLLERKTATSKIMCAFKIKGSVPTSKKIINKVWTLEIQHGKNTTTIHLLVPRHTRLKKNSYPNSLKKSKSSHSPTSSRHKYCYSFKPLITRRMRQTRR